jgi:hypothetical protein
VSVVALAGTFDGEPIFVALRVTDRKGKSAILPPPEATYRAYDDGVPGEPEPPSPGGPASAASAPAAQIRTISGLVDDTWAADVRGRGTVLMARVRLPGGDEVKLDLGPPGNLPEGFRLVPGSRVEATGRFVRSGDEQVLLVRVLTQSLHIRR